MWKLPEGGRKPDIGFCFQAFMETTITAPKERQIWIVLPIIYPYPHLLPPLQPHNTSLSGKERGPEILRLFFYSLRYFLLFFFWPVTTGRWEKNSRVDNTSILNIFHGWANCCMAVTFIIYRHPESTALNLSVPLCKPQESL